ncbi:hypothetical protein FQA39_LY00360 [Lamprigera yunnana]|nr:hypothetical protein FQA39_LY00360 [Lamprigera yunnana]
MKIYFIALICILVEIHAQDSKGMERKYSNALLDCKKIHKVTFREVNDYYKLLEEGGSAAESFCECLLRRLNCIDQNSKIMYNEFKKTPFPYAPSSGLNDIVDHCSYEKGSTCSKTAHKFLRCIEDSIQAMKPHN